MKKDWGKLEVGALWKKQSKSGSNFYSGSLTIDGKKIKVVGFANQDRKENQPDVRLYLDEEKDAK